MTQTRVTALLMKHAEVSPAIAARHALQACALLKEKQAQPQVSVAQAYPVVVKSLLRQMKNILAELEVLDGEIATLYRSHPNKELIDSLPGVADKLGPVLAAEIGTDLARFQGVKALKAFAGVCPVTGQSGKYKSVFFRRACNKQLRRAVHLASQAALHKPWARELFDRLRSQGKTYGRSLRAVGEQLLEILYAILQRGVPYNDEYHMQMKVVHGRTCH